MILTTKRLAITPLGMEDLPKLWEWKSGRAGRMMHTLIPVERDFEAFREEFQRGRYSAGLAYSVHVRPKLELAGVWWSTQPNPIYPEMIASVMFGPEFHGKGYDVESGRALLKHWLILGARRFVVYVDSKNIPAKRLAMRLGCKLEGTHEYPGRGDIEIWASLGG